MRLKLLLVFVPLLVTVKAEELLREDSRHYSHVEQPIHRIPRPLPQPTLVREWIPREPIIPAPAPSTEALPESTLIPTPAPPPLPAKGPIQRPILRPVPPPVRPIYRPPARPFYRPAIRPPPRPLQTPAPQPTPQPEPTTPAPQPLPEPEPSTLAPQPIPEPEPSTLAPKPIPQPEPTTPAPLPEPHTEAFVEPEPETQRPLLRPAPRPLQRPTVPRPWLRPAPWPLQPTPEQKIPRPIIPQPVPRPVITQKPIPQPTTAAPIRPVTRPIPVTTTTTRRPKPLSPARELPIINEDLGTPIDYNCGQDGYYSVAGECDSYIQCSQRSALKFLCPDGLYFNKKARWSEYPCAIPSEVRCEPGTVIHESQPTDECPHQNGFFAMRDGDCSRYISCEYGLASIMTCPPGLAFNAELSACDWPENVPSCRPTVFEGFTCPAASPDDDPDWIYKYRHGRSCKLYIACQRGHPRLLRCDPGLAFDEAAETCIDDQYVSNCIN
ncbi:chitin binding peritrophin-A domain-containing protein [Phthorimaea operculella]|nr:chitin binding peritrophin-A domain-containing protein [Phthorimaea operculella]